MNKALFVFLETANEKSNIEQLKDVGVPVENKNVCLANGVDHLMEKLRQQNPLFIFIKEVERRGTSKRDDLYTCALHDIAVYNQKRRVRCKVIIYGNSIEPKMEVGGIEYLSIDRIPVVLNLN